MLVSCWSVKGGVGTTVVAAALAMLLAARSPAGSVLADLAGDCPAVLGLPDPPRESPGLSAWLAAGPETPADALRRLEVPAAPGVALLPRGDPSRRPGPGRPGLLAAVLDQGPRPTVADCGRLPSTVATDLVTRARQSLLVLRPCYLALRRAAQCPLRPTGVVLIREPGRALTATDIDQTLATPVVATLDLDPAVARAVDAGLLATRLPRSLSRPLAKAIPDVT